MPVVILFYQVQPNWFCNVLTVNLIIKKTHSDYREAYLFKSVKWPSIPLHERRAWVEFHSYLEELHSTKGINMINMNMNFC